MYECGICERELTIDDRDIVCIKCYEHLKRQLNEKRATMDADPITCQTCGKYVVNRPFDCDCKLREAIKRLELIRNLCSEALKTELSGKG